MGENVIELTIDKVRVTLDVDLDCSIGDLSRDMDQIASQIAWYGRVYAAAQHAANLADANYRSWRAVASEDALARSGGKLAEHLIKNKVEATPEFIEHKKGICYFDELVTRLQKALLALEVKADILRSRAALERAEWGATGMVSRAAEPTQNRVAPATVRDTPKAAERQERDAAIEGMPFAEQRERRRRPQPESTRKGNE